MMIFGSKGKQLNGELKQKNIGKKNGTAAKQSLFYINPCLC